VAEAEAAQVKRTPITMDVEDPTDQLAEHLDGDAWDKTFIIRVSGRDYIFMLVKIHVREVVQ
jgi:hypothetical protein